MAREPLRLSIRVFENKQKYPKLAPRHSEIPQEYVAFSLLYPSLAFVGQTKELS
jgi:hypothetical protein